MKKLNLFPMLLVAVVMMLGLTNCKKDLKESTPVSKQYVAAIDGSFIAQDGDLSLAKSFNPLAPVGVNRTWTMYTSNTIFYPSANPFALVKGLEFLQTSDPYTFWSNPSNNPITFAAGQGVYSNLTPAEDLRLITETTDADGKVAYLGMLDFNPTAANFPLTVHGYRLGDVLAINLDDLRNMDGGSNFNFSVRFNLSPIDMLATKMGTISGHGLAVPTGTEFTWEDVKYGAPVSVTVPVTTEGDFVLYNGLDSKVTGMIILTVTEKATGHQLNYFVPAGMERPGKGRLFVLKTTKLGWYDSGTVSITDKDITITTQDWTIQ